MKEINTTIKTKRNTDMPVTIIDGEIGKGPLVIYVHGFKANRTEDGRFLEMARRLNAYGICMGFAGCDVTEEGFFSYTLDNCLDDIETAYTYMLENYDIDGEHLGIVGYSMGGRLSTIFTNRHKEFKTMGLWAAATQDSSFDDDVFLGNNLKKLIDDYKEKGYCEFFNLFDNNVLKMNYKLIENMVEYRPCEYLKEYEGSVILVHGTKDIAVDPKASEVAYNSLDKANKKVLHVIEETDHGFGFWDNHMEKSEELVSNTATFFKENL